jgi:hypothetical protein
MPVYRMYFRMTGQIHGREDFEAADDVAAIRIARVLYFACSDVSDGFNLWQGSRQLRTRLPRHQRANLNELIEADHKAAIETLEHLRESRWLVAESRRLIEELDRAKAAAKYKLP